MGFYKLINYLRSALIPQQPYLSILSILHILGSALEIVRHLVELKIKERFS